MLGRPPGLDLACLVDGPPVEQQLLSLRGDVACMINQ